MNTDQGFSNRVHTVMKNPEKYFSWKVVEKVFKVMKIYLRVKIIMS